MIKLQKWLQSLIVLKSENPNSFGLKKCLKLLPFVEVGKSPKVWTVCPNNMQSLRVGCKYLPWPNVHNFPMTGGGAGLDSTNCQRWMCVDARIWNCKSLWHLPIISPNVPPDNTTTVKLGVQLSSSWPVLLSVLLLDLNHYFLTYQMGN